MGYLVVNFGGPRHLEEIPLFLEELLCDPDIIRPKLPRFLHNWFFRRIARKRSKTSRHDYESIGGKSPIYFDTEAIKESLKDSLQQSVVSFHRYLSATHENTFTQLSSKTAWTVLPLFPQFSYATTGSIARILEPYGEKLHWIKSYATHPAYIAAQTQRIHTFLEDKRLLEEETLLLFSAHGLPQEFIDTGDPYEKECNASFQALLQNFPKAQGILCYQSKFGKGEWLKPYTQTLCENILEHTKKQNVVIVPLSFTSDHIETLFEIEKLYLPLIAKNGLKAYRCPALNREPYWIEALAEIAKEKNLTSNHTLIYRKK